MTDQKSHQGASGSHRPSVNRSTIKFPYGDLDEAIEVAEAIHKNAGTECTRSQLAAFLNQSPKGGSFRLKIATASHFGLVKSSQGKVRLTDLGREIVDPAREAQARVQAFYNIPLYKQIYDMYEGHRLPPARGLEQTIAHLGVSDKQKDKARQAFQRSAKQAGFFHYQSDRLVQPIGGMGDTEGSTGEPEVADHSPANASAPDLTVPDKSHQYHPFIQGLLDSLPEPNQAWDAKNQARWLQAAAHIFGLLYKRDEEIEVTVKGSQTDGSSGSRKL